MDHGASEADVVAGFALVECSASAGAEPVGAVAPSSAFVDSHFVGDEVAEFFADFGVFVVFDGEGAVHGFGVFACAPVFGVFTEVGVVVAIEVVDDVGGAVVPSVAYLLGCLGVVV